MTSPTGPDRDRLRASDAGQDESAAERSQRTGECICTSTERMRGRPFPECGAHRPAPQQPPAQEREYRSPSGVISESMAEVEARIAADEEQLAQAAAIMADQYAPPSEAASAGEVERLARRLQQADPDAPRYAANGQTVIDWDDPHTDRDHYRTFAATLAASSGVRGGDDQARERLADVLDIVAVMTMHQHKGADPEVFAAYVGQLRRAAGGQP